MLKMIIQKSFIFTIILVMMISTSVSNVSAATKNSNDKSVTTDETKDSLNVLARVKSNNKEQLESLSREYAFNNIPTCREQKDNGRIILSFEYIVEIYNDYPAMLENAKKYFKVGRTYSSGFASNNKDANIYSSRATVKEVYDYDDEGFFVKFSYDITDTGTILYYLRYGDTISGCDWDKWFYNYLSDEDRAIINHVEATFNEVISEDMSDYERELAIHDWMLDNASYAHDENGGPAEKHDAYDILINGEGVCDAYAKAFMYLSWKAGIYCEKVSGEINDGGSHAWNIVRLDDDYYMVDSCWDDSGNCTDEASRHMFFNLTDDEMKDIGNRTWNETKYPSCTGTKYEYNN